MTTTAALNISGVIGENAVQEASGMMLEIKAPVLVCEQ